MKKTLIITLILILFGLGLFIFFVKSEYKKEGIIIDVPNVSIITNDSDQKISLINLSNFNSVDNQKNIYLDKLESCNDESYFYDSKSDITILKYEIVNSSMFRRINIEYEKGNKCANSFVLESKWYDDLYEKEILSMEIKVCDEDCLDYNVAEEDFDQVLNYFFGTNFIRVSNKEKLNSNGNYILNIYYGYHILEVFKHNDNYVAFNLIDSNEMSKNAVYYYDDFRSVDKLFKLLDL